MCKGNSDSLTAMQLIFQNGYETPFFKSAHAKESSDKVGTININPNQKIRNIQFRVYNDRELFAMRMLDDQDAIVCEVDWYTSDREFTALEIPEGQQIVGLAVSAEDTFITRIGFILASCAE